MKLKIVVKGNVATYYGEDKLECVAGLVEADTVFTNTVKSVADLLRENISQMVNDEDIAVMALGAVTKGFGYVVIWEGEKE